MTLTEMTFTEMLAPGSGASLAPDRIDLPCQTAGEADLWFAEEPAELEAAKALCRECPLQAPCLDEALVRAEPWGVWGGEIFDRGAIVARKRPRGRPRKNPLPDGRR